MVIEGQRKHGMASVQDAANYLSITRNTLYRLIKSGKVPHRILGKSIRVSWDWLYSQAEYSDTTVTNGGAA